MKTKTEKKEEYPSLLLDGKRFYFQKEDRERIEAIKKRLLLSLQLPGNTQEPVSYFQRVFLGFRFFLRELGQVKQQSRHLH